MARSRWAIAAPALQLELPAPTLLRAVAAAVVPQPSTWTSGPRGMVSLSCLLFWERIFSEKKRMMGYQAGSRWGFQNSKK